MRFWSERISRKTLAALLLTAVLLTALVGRSKAQSTGPAPPVLSTSTAARLFERDNLWAWCIVPFDSQRRGPEERAAMLAKLGFKHFAYDYRAEHVPTFAAEIEACKKHGVSLDAWWFPGSLNNEAKLILDVCQKAQIRPQLWITGGGGPTNSREETQRRVEQEAARIRPIAEAAAKQDMKVGLYNHGGWFGEPENQLLILKELNLPNVGIVYNLHHGHAHLDRFAEILAKCQNHLLAVNLNGMVRNGDQQGQKILQLGQGDLDLSLLRSLRDSGYQGPIGILGHTQDDAEARLQDNLDGLDWLVPQLDGKPAGPKPQPRTPVPGAAKPGPQRAATSTPGYLIAGRNEYRLPPLTVELTATVYNPQHYNILAASDPKPSGAHWEVFSMVGSGALTAYLPGMRPDHVRSTASICDGQRHHIAMIYESKRVRLFLDGKLVADQAIESGNRAPVNGDLAFGRLVEGGIGCDGQVHIARLSRGVREISIDSKSADMIVDPQTLGLWKFDAPDATEVADQSTLKNPARRATAAATRPNVQPTAGPHLKALNADYQVTLIDQSPDAVYLGVKVDRDGNLFVGGREGLFLFALKPDGNYAARQELLRFPQDSIIMGLEFKDDDLYVLTSNALYLVPRGRVQRTKLQPQRILWGLPLDLHVSFHCLAWGPDGDLYVTHGDPLLNYGDWKRPDHWGHWTLYCGRDNQPRPYTGQGAVLRMRPDGTNVRVVATGLRGPVGLAFTADGHLFTNDNDHESRADQYAPARLLHVLPGVDFAWPRGWMASKSPDRFDLIEPVVADLGRGVPCDLLAYGDEELAEYQHKLLMCRWDRKAVTAYRLVPRGVSFSAKEETILQGEENCRPVGIATGRGGRLFVTNLYMAGNMAAPYCASDLVMVSRKNTKQSASPNSSVVRQAEPRGSIYDPSVRSVTELLADAQSDDTYQRQLAVRDLARRATDQELETWSRVSEPRLRLAAVLAAGHKLTVPDPDSVPLENIELSYPKENAFFKRAQPFYGTAEKIDLATLGRVGSFTIAQWWAVVERTPERQALFALLMQALRDPAEDVRLQAAYFLALLNDPQSEPLVINTRRNVQLQRLAAAPERRVSQVWSVGPFEDGNDATLARAHAPEQDSLDLTVRFGARGWEAREITRAAATTNRTNGQVSHYWYFRVQSGTRQTALVSLNGAGPARLWQNGTAVADSVPASAARPATEAQRLAWLVDLQPGGNDFLLRLAGHEAEPVADLRFRGPAALEVTLPEKLDSALLAARLRDAAQSGGTQPLSPEFLSTNWTTAAEQGDPQEGRRLYGTLGCTKCHAIAPDQKSGGAPSLLEAKRRFTIPHLVESILLPSQHIAEPFRGQTLVLDDGRTFTGLVVAESQETLELLLPDATRRVIEKQQIEERGPNALSPMPAGLVRTPDELRHLLRYLLLDRPSPP